MDDSRKILREGAVYKQLCGAFLALWLAAGCSNVRQDIPAVNQADKLAALAEIEAYSEADTPGGISNDEAARRLYDVYGKIRPAAREVCRHAGESRACAWEISYSDLDEYNAFATSGNRVTVFQGIISATENDDQLAFVLAHELGHHIANHINETRTHANAGILVTGLALATVTHGSIGCTTDLCLSNLQNAAQASMQMGGNIGILLFSVEQEIEADYLAAYILGLAGYDLASSRTMLVKFAARSDETETGFLDSHPAGPERLASYDKAIQVVRNDPDGLPGKDSFVVREKSPDGGSTATGSERDPKDARTTEYNFETCRIYLPAENICIH
jgi:Zn-dependent protease with chaperone function